MTKSFNALGVYPANVTARSDNGEVDLVQTKAVVDFLYSKGVDGLHVCGTTGEFATLSVEQRKSVTEACIEAAEGRGTIIVQVGAINTNHSCELAKHAAQAGAQAVSSVPPFYYPSTREIVAHHYRAIAKACGLPVIIYDNPTTTGFTVTVDLAKELAEEGTVHGTKLARQDMVSFARLGNLLGGRFVLYPVETFYLAGLATAANVGTIGSMSNWIPEAFVGIRDNFKAGNLVRAAQLQRLVCELIFTYQGEEMAVTKELVAMRGVPCGDPWQPLLPLSKQERQALRDRIARFKIDFDSLAKVC